MSVIGCITLNLRRIRVLCRPKFMFVANISVNIKISIALSGRKKNPDFF